VRGDERLVQDHTGRLDPELAALRHGVPRVDRHVEQHLLELDGVGPHQARARVEPHRQRDGLSQQEPEHRPEPGDDGGRLDEPGLDGRLPAHGEELLGEGGRPLGRLVDQGHVAPRRILGSEPVEQERGAAPDHGQEVVEVVGEAAGQPPDRLDVPSRLERRPARAGRRRRRLGRPRGAPALDLDDPVARPSAPVADEGRRDQPPPEPALPVAIALLPLVRLDRAGSELAVESQLVIEVVRVGQGPPAGPEELGLAVPEEPAEGPVHPEVAAVEGLEGHPDRGGLEQPPEAPVTEARPTGARSGRPPAGRRAHGLGGAGRPPGSRRSGRHAPARYDPTPTTSGGTTGSGRICSSKTPGVGHPRAANPARKMARPTPCQGPGNRARGPGVEDAGADLRGGRRAIPPGR
jgi:hypothetical protein